MVFDTEKKTAQRVYKGDIKFENSPHHAAVLFKENEVLAMVQGPNRDYMIMKLIKTEFEEYVIETQSLREAVNANDEVAAYDSNYVLKRKGMPVLDEIEK